MKLKFLTILVSVLLPMTAWAGVTLLDKDDWKVQMGGFVEMDMFRDSTRSLTEVQANNPVAKQDRNDPAGDNGRMQTSIRHSRLAFTVLAPLVDGVKSKGYFEFDLMGYDPSPSGTGTKNTESSFYTNSTFRVRHAYMSTESNGWQLLVGQHWGLFGWNPMYVPTSASVTPGPGTVFQRTVQVTGIKAIESDNNKIQIGASMARASQADSGMPNFDAGARYSYSGLMSGFSSPQGEVLAQPLSVAISGTMRQFAYAASTTDSSVSKSAGSAFAVNTMLPLLQADGGDVSNSLTLIAEYSSGSGYGDSFPAWTGGASQMPSGTGPMLKTNLDAGQGGFDGNGDFVLVKLSTWTTSLQYHFPKAWHAFANLGLTQLASSNIGQVGGTYDQSKFQFINFFHDFTPQIRAAVEWSQMGTRYVDGTNSTNNRYQLNAYFRF